MVTDYFDVKLETKDLILKKAEFEDWKTIYYNLWRHKESAKYMLWQPTETDEDAKDRMKRTIAFEEKPENKHFGVKPIVLIDEYDTPLIEAYTDGYWDEMITTCRQLFHNTLKENDYLGRAIITGVTKVSKNSLFSDLNNLLVATVTDDIYTDCCGFTEQEVMDALKCQNIDDMKKVKEMYDGFVIGHQKDIYNSNFAHKF